MVRSPSSKPPRSPGMSLTETISILIILLLLQTFLRLWKSYTSFMHRISNPLNPEGRLGATQTNTLMALIIMFPKCTNTVWASRKERKKCFENKNNHQKEKMAFSLLAIASFLYFVLINTVGQSRGWGPHPGITCWNLSAHFPSCPALTVAAVWTDSYVH